MPSQQVKMIFAVLGLAWLLTSGCVSNNVVKKVSAPPNNKERAKDMKGVFYALPLTVTNVKLPVTKTSRKAGNYWRYTRFFFPDQPSIVVPTKEDKETPKDIVEGASFELGKPVLSLSGEPDPDEIYLAEIKGGWFGGFFEDKQLSVALSDSGILTSGSAETTNQALPIAIKAFTTLASTFRTAAFTAGSPNKPGKQGDDAGNQCPNETPISKEQLCLPKGEQKKSPAEKKRKSSNQQPLDQSALDSTCPDLEFYESLKEDSEKEFFLRLAAPADREFYRTMIYPGASEQERRTYQRLCSNERAFVRRLPADLQKCYLALDDQERNLFRSWEIAERQFLCKLSTLEARAYYAGLATAADRNKFRNFVAALAAFKWEDFEKAKEVAENIRDLQKKRFELFSATNITVSVDILQLQLKELDTAINKLAKQYFIGTEKETVWTGDFDFIPHASRTVGGKRQPPVREASLLALSEAHGACSLDTNEPGPPSGFNSKLCDDKEFQKTTIIKVQVLPGRRSHSTPIPQTADVIRSADLTQKGKRGFYYRVPAEALAKIISVEGNKEGEVIMRQPVTVAQYGVTVSLPASSGGRKTNYSLELSEVTGAMKNFSLGSEKLIQESMFDSVGGAVNSLIEGKKAEDAASETATQNANDELSKLMRRRQILEEQVKIRAAEETLKQP